MFISIFQARYLKETITFAPHIVVGSVVVFGIITFVVGLSWYLIPAMALPFVEFFLRFRGAIKGPGPLISTLLIFMTHAIFLELLQQEVTGVSRLSANVQYIALLSLALGAGAFLFKADILAENEAVQDR